MHILKAPSRAPASPVLPPLPAGSIGPRELCHAMRALGHELSRSEAAAIIDHADTTGSGRLDFPDFVDAVASGLGPLHPTYSAPRALGGTESARERAAWRQHERQKLQRQLESRQRERRQIEAQLHELEREREALGFAREPAQMQQALPGPAPPHLSMGQGFAHSVGSSIGRTLGSSVVPTGRAERASNNPGPARSAAAKAQPPRQGHHPARPEQKRAPPRSPSTPRRGSARLPSPGPAHAHTSSKQHRVPPAAAMYNSATAPRPPLDAQQRRRGDKASALAAANAIFN